MTADKVILTNLLCAAGAPPVPNDPAASPAVNNAAVPTVPSPGATGANGGSPTPAPNANDNNIRELRTNYERTKTDLEKYTKLGKHEEISQHVQRWTAIESEALNIGKQLGYTEKEVREALGVDPIKTMHLLRTKARQGGARNPDVSKLVEEQVQKHLTPFQERMNAEATERAEQSFNGEFDRLLKDAFPSGLAPEVEDIFYNVTSEMMKYDEAALQRLKNEGKVADVAVYFQKSKDILVKAFQAWQKQEEAGLSGNSPTPSRPPGQKRPTLDEMIENPGLINKRYS